MLFEMGQAGDMWLLAHGLACNACCMCSKALLCPVLQAVMLRCKYDTPALWGVVSMGCEHIRGTDLPCAAHVLPCWNPRLVVMD